MYLRDCFVLSLLLTKWRQIQILLLVRDPLLRVCLVQRRGGEGDILIKYMFKYMFGSEGEGR
jgi:hypothetical protein